MSATRAVPEVNVDRAELIASLRPIVRLLKPKGKAQAVMTFVDGSILIELPGLETSVSATGASECVKGFETKLSSFFM